MRGLKSGRRASDPDREEARKWVELYRRAQQEPDGRLCLNPDQDPEVHTWIDGHDPEHLLRMLEDLAEHGHFHPETQLEKSIRLLPLRMDYRRAIAEGQTHSQVIHDLAERYNKTTRQIENYIYEIP